MTSHLPLLLLLALGCTVDNRPRVDTGPFDAGPTQDSATMDVPANPDGDGDGVQSPGDTCPNTAPGEPVDGAGCSTLDSDGDGVLNDMDVCADTPAGANVDGAGCPLGNEGTLSGMWLIRGAPATSATCSGAGITTVRLVVDQQGSNFLRRDFPCEQGAFDGREDMSAPKVPLNQALMSYWQAVDAGGAVIDESETLDLNLTAPVMHAVLASPDFMPDVTP